MLIACCAYRYIQYAVFICFHNVSDCHLTHLFYSLWMSVQKFCYWDLRYMWVVWQVCVVCWHFQGFVCVCVCVCVCLCVCVRIFRWHSVVLFLRSWQCTWCMCSQDEKSESSEKKSAKDALLLWCQHKTNGYPGVNIQDFTGMTSESLLFTSICTLGVNLISWFDCVCRFMA